MNAQRSVDARAFDRDAHEGDVIAGREPQDQLGNSGKGMRMLVAV
jgi:hypothetical protein